MTDLYFGYGANTNHDSMDVRCPTAEYLGKAKLPGYKLVFRGVADVVPHKGSRVVGALWRLKPNDLAALDRFEGYPRLYTRGELRVVLPDGSTVNAITYWMVAAHRRISPPNESYWNCLKNGYANCALPTVQLYKALEYSLKS